MIIAVTFQCEFLALRVSERNGTLSNAAILQSRLSRIDIHVLDCPYTSIWHSWFRHIIGIVIVVVSLVEPVNELNQGSGS